MSCELSNICQKARTMGEKWVGGRLVGRKKEGKEVRSMSIRSQKKDRKKRENRSKMDWRHVSGRKKRRRGGKMG